MIKILLLGVSLAATAISNGDITAEKNLSVRSEKTSFPAKKPGTSNSAAQTGSTKFGECASYEQKAT